MNKIQGKSTPRLANNRTLCCKQVVHITTFRSNQTEYFRSITTQIARAVYLLECIKCDIKYVGKAETEFNIRLNKHRQGLWKTRNYTDKLSFFWQKP